VSAPDIKLDGEDIDENLTAAVDTQKVTASITFTFLADTTGREDVNTTFNFEDVAFTLEQVIA
jgi:alternate signal-mediated exported protein